jgi:hypothetical protein
MAPVVHENVADGYGDSPGEQLVHRRFSSSSVTRELYSVPMISSPPGVTDASGHALEDAAEVTNPAAGGEGSTNAGEP